jgi:hypothetical protein
MNCSGPFATSDPSADNACEILYWICPDANYNVPGVVDSSGTLREGRVMVDVRVWLAPAREVARRGDMTAETPEPLSHGPLLPCRCGI